MFQIAILVPCYNEGLTIRRVVEDYRAALPEATVYVYDNNSTDETADIARAAGAVVRYERRQGKGNVVKRMLREIDADCYLMVDGDDTYPADKAREMVELVQNGYDMVIGDRLSSTYFTENKRPFHNSGNRLVRRLINLLFSANVHDIMTGSRAMSRRFAKGFPILSGGFEIETEMTVHALDKGYAIAEVPVPYRDRPEGSVSKLNTARDGVKVLSTIFLLFRDYKPFAFFSILSLLCILLSAILFIPILVTYVQTGLVPRFPTLIVSGVALVIGILFWMCGIILEALLKKHRMLYEMLMIER